MILPLLYVLWLFLNHNKELQEFTLSVTRKTHDTTRTRSLLSLEQEKPMAQLSQDLKSY